MPFYLSEVNSNVLISFPSHKKTLLLKVKVGEVDDGFIKIFKLHGKW